MEGCRLGAALNVLRRKGMGQRMGRLETVLFDRTQMEPCAEHLKASQINTVRHTVRLFSEQHKPCVRLPAAVIPKPCSSALRERLPAELIPQSECFLDRKSVV